MLDGGLKEVTDTLGTNMLPGDTWRLVVAAIGNHGAISEMFLRFMLISEIPSEDAILNNTEYLLHNTITCEDILDRIDKYSDSVLIV